MSNRIPVILDTDIGSDIDDAVALAYLLRQPGCELVGITTVSGDVVQRAACAEVICREAGAPNIPIHTGVSNVLLTGPGQPNVPQYAGIKHRPHRTDYPANTAVDFLRQTIRRRPGEITLLSIGPLANIALLFALDPEIPSLLKSFVSMAGIFFPDRAQAGGGPYKIHREWNVFIDPVASAMVYSAKVPGHISIGLDVTTKCQMPAEQVRQRFAAKPLNIVLETAEVWFQHAKTICFHDPLAAAIIFQPDLCTYQTGRVNVPVDANPHTFGQSLFTADPAGPHRVAQHVDPARFFEHYFGFFT